MNRKGKSLNKQCFYRNNVLWYQKLQHVFECCPSALTQTHSRFATRLSPCWWYVVRSQPRNPLFSCVKSLCCYGNHTAGSKEI